MNLKRWSLLIELSIGLQSLVYTEINAGEVTLPWGAPMFAVMVVEMVMLILIHCFLSVRYSQMLSLDLCLPVLFLLILLVVLLDFCFHCVEFLIPVHAPGRNQWFQIEQ